MLLGALAVVEAVEGANQVAGDAADALEGLGLGGMETALELLAVDVDLNPADGLVVLGGALCDGGDLGVAQLVVAADGDVKALDAVGVGKSARLLLGVDTAVDLVLLPFHCVSPFDRV